MKFYLFEAYYVFEQEPNSERHGRTLGNLNRQDSNPLPQRAAPGLGFDSQQTTSQVPAAVNPGYQQPLVMAPINYSIPFSTFESI